MCSRPEEPIRIVSYDPGWPRAFEEERTGLQEAIGEWSVGGIHHVGGTAVPGVEGEPVLDILVGVEELPPPRGCLAALAERGYASASAGETPVFCRSADSRHCHLRLLAAGATPFHRMLAFRDLLRADLQMAIGYAGMKRDLARRHGADREGYALAKGELVEAVFDCLAERIGPAGAELS